MVLVAAGASVSCAVALNGCGEPLSSDCATSHTCVDNDAASVDGTTDGLVTVDGNGFADVDAAQDGSSIDAPMEATVSCDAATAITCNGQCVDSTQPAHCGSCMNVCTAPTHGQATCTAPSTCGITCDTTYHACNGACLPDSNEPSMDACVVSDALGVFVSPTGSDTIGCGTKAAPCQTIGKGLTVAKAAGKRTYVCEGTYNEQLVVDATLDNIKVFGGFSCAGNTWAYDVNKKPKVLLSAGGYAMIVSTPTSALFEDFAFEAKSAMTAGESSVAIFAKNAMGVVLRRVSVKAGNGVAPAAAVGAANNYSGTMAPDGGAPSGTGRGPAGAITCTDGTSSAGGLGGDVATVGMTQVPHDGDNGTWNPTGTTSTGQDGLGGHGGQFSCATNSDPGANGAAGTAGPGATTAGSLDATGWHASPGGAATYGKPAQGGGGGGAKATPATGGGGGGAGGCGGGAGAAGQGGGASVAVLSFHSAVTLDTCVVTTGNGGAGGAGGAGQNGQGGGAFATTGAYCQGNYGGNGGGGGGGGGGAGGVSVGVLYSMTAPTLTSTMITPGSLGAGGAGGSGGIGGTNALGTGAAGAPGNVGPAGTTAQTLAVP